MEAVQLARQHGLSLSGQRPGVGEYLRRLWDRRAFIVTFARAKVTASYASATLGSFWTVITPLVNAGVYYLIFGVLLGTDHGVTNFIAYLCTGVFVFHFTQQVAMAGTRSIADNLNLVRALHFPRASLPLALTLVQLQQLLAALAVLAAIVLVTGERISWSWLLVAPVVGLQTVFNAGLAMILARLAARTTDLKQLMPFVLRTWLYGSGVFYSLDSFIDGAPGPLATLLRWNPMVAFIDLMRYALIGSLPDARLPGRLWLSAGLWALVVGVGGFLFFWQAEEEYGRE
jgi:teichoic acid transport system permease protein